MAVRGSACRGRDTGSVPDRDRSGLRNQGLSNGLKGHQKPMPIISIGRGSDLLRALRTWRGEEPHQAPYMRAQHQAAPAVRASRALGRCSGASTEAPATPSADKRVMPASTANTRQYDAPDCLISYCPRFAVLRLCSARQPERDDVAWGWRCPSRLARRPTPSRNAQNGRACCSIDQEHHGHSPIVPVHQRVGCRRDMGDQEQAPGRI